MDKSLNHKCVTQKFKISLVVFLPQKHYSSGRGGIKLCQNKELSGEPDEYGVIRAIIYDAHLDGDTFTLEGTLNFKNDMSQDPIGKL